MDHDRVVLQELGHERLLGAGRRHADDGRPSAVRRQHGRAARARDDRRAAPRRSPERDRGSAPAPRRPCVEQRARRDLDRRRRPTDTYRRSARADRALRRRHRPGRRARSIRASPAAGRCSSTVRRDGTTGTAARQRRAARRTARPAGSRRTPRRGSAPPARSRSGASAHPRRRRRTIEPVGIVGTDGEDGPRVGRPAAIEAVEIDRPARRGTRGRSAAGRRRRGASGDRRADSWEPASARRTGRARTRSLKRIEYASLVLAVSTIRSASTRRPRRA